MKGRTDAPGRRYEMDDVCRRNMKGMEDSLGQHNEKEDECTRKA